MWNAPEPRTLDLTAPRTRRARRAGPACFVVIAMLVGACSTSTPAASSATAEPATAAPASAAPPSGTGVSRTGVGTGVGRP